MSLHTLAQTLQKQGRGEDSVLVHMTPKEVSGLQTLALAHGGSLTINPETGLPEAGFLKNILPAVVGIGATMMGVPAWGVGLASGLTSYATNRNPQQALLSGLLSGGLAGLSGGVASAGESALGDLSSVGGIGKDLITQQSAITPETFGSMPSDLPGVAAHTGMDGAKYFADPNAAGQWTTSSLTANTPPITPNGAVANAPGYYNTNAPSYGDKLSAGLKTVAKNPIDFIKANPYASAAAGVGALGMVPPPTQVPLQPLTTQNQGQERPYRYTPYNQETRANPYYTPMYAGGGGIPYPGGMAVGGVPTSDYDARIDGHGDIFKMAAGGRVDGYKTGGPYGKPGPIYGVAGTIYGADSSKVGPYKNTDEYSSVKEQMSGMSPSMLDKYAKGAKDPIVMAAAQDELYKRERAPQAYTDIPTPQMAEGGLTSLKRGAFVVPADVVSHAGNGSTKAGIATLNKHINAKPISGRGDGMSDSIPTTIEGKQQARVADGEALVEPQDVARIGKGSPDRGAKKLYAMMDKIRKARTGTTKQGKQINPAKFMPA